MANDQIQFLIAHTIFLGETASNSLLVQTMELALADKVWMPCVPGNGVQFIYHGRINRICRYIPDFCQVVAYQRAQTACMLSAYTLKAVLDHIAVDDIGSTGDRSQHSASAGDRIQRSSVKASFFQYIKDQLCAEWRLFCNGVIRRKILGAVAKRILEQFFLVIKNRDFCRCRARIDY